MSIKLSIKIMKKDAEYFLCTAKQLLKCLQCIMSTLSATKFSKWLSLESAQKLQANTFVLKTAMV